MSSCDINRCSLIGNLSQERVSSLGGIGFYSGEGRFIHSISPEEEQKEEAGGEFFALEPLTKDLHLWELYWGLTSEPMEVLLPASWPMHYDPWQLLSILETLQVSFPNISFPLLLVEHLQTSKINWFNHQEVVFLFHSSSPYAILLLLFHDELK